MKNWQNAKVYKMKILNKTFLFLFTLLLSGCYDYDKTISDARDNKHNHPEVRVFDGETEPSFPNEVENNKTLLGIDENRNGVRDDLDIWINFVGRDRNHRTALRELARVYSEMLIAGNETNSGLIQKSARNFYDARACASFIEWDRNFEEKASTQMTKLVYNTDIRIQTSKSYHSITFMYESNHEGMHAGKEYIGCKFEIDDLQEIIKKSEERNKLKSFKR